MRVLVAEDAPAMRRVIAHRIADWGHDVVETGDGFQAWQALSASDPPGIAVLDWVMPGMDGLEICERLHSRGDGPFVFRILLTSRTDKQDRLDALSRGAHDFLTKPVDFDELRCRVAIGERLVSAHARLRAYACEMERLAAERAEQLVRADKMMVLGAMAASIAHDACTPIGSAATSFSFLAEETAKVRADLASGALTRSALDGYLSNAAETCAIAKSALERAGSLMRSFKTVAVEQSSEQLETFNLKKYVDDTLITLRSKLRKARVDIAVSCPEDLVLTSCPGVFSQIIINLVDNSLAHAFPPGHAGGQIAMDISRLGGEVRIVYTDNGRGIPPDALPRVFERFFTTRRGEGGSGLGLNIVKDIVERRLKGQVELWSEPGRGVRFLLRFPA